MAKENLADRLFDLASGIGEQEGLALVDVEYVRAGSKSTVRVFIDKPGGVTLDDCQAFSDRFGYVLDRDDPIPHAYSLEVSSPGLTRSLTKPHHYRYFAGRRVKVVCRSPRDGANTFSGVLKGLEDQVVVLEVAGEEVRISLDEVARARLLGDWA
ncbi:MAG: ribosome maturation factor RimP [Peptococcaceae bacterium]|jgi:ribosome maturation factor RimP|nr:ribosome maturation factor RimP [Peptococcaceae bacterium]